MPKREKSDFSRAFSEDGARKTHVGGQALIEGIMMRGKYNWSVAVREPAGTIYTEEHDLASGKGKNGWMHKPLVRGCRALVESLILGYKALEIAALHAFAEDEGETDAKAADESSETVREIRKDGGTESAENQAAGASVEAANEAADTPQTADEATAFVESSLGCAASGNVVGAGENAAEGNAAEEERTPSEAAEPFSWKRDFGRPDTMVDALAAQRALEVVAESAGQPPADAAGDAVQADGKADEAKGVEFGHKEMVASMVVGLVLGVVLFIVAPAALTNLIVGEYDSNTLLWNIVDGLLRVAVFVFYIWLIGRMEDIKRMFGYHGAEHKTIHCYEHGLPLTPENARSFPRLHVRCGTAFLIMVMIIAILVYTITPINALIEAWGVPDGLPKLALVIASRIVLMPVIAGLSYEITVRWAGTHPDNPLVKVILWPGMQMQYLTTREPDDGQIECAIAAMRLVLEREEEEARRLAQPEGQAASGANAAS